MEKEKRRLLKYPKYFILGLYASYKDDPSEFLLDLAITGMVIGIPILAPFFYFTIDLNEAPTGIPVILSILIAIAVWWSFVFFLSVIFVMVPKIFKKIGSYIDRGETEEYKIFEMLRKRRQ